MYTSNYWSTINDEINKYVSIGIIVMNLPKIVILENHKDPMTKLYQTQLITQLKQRGYDTFLDEAPQGVGLQDKIDHHKESADQFYSNRDKIRKALNWFKGNSSKTEQLTKLSSDIERYDPDSVQRQTQSMYQKLDDENVHYRAIDTPINMESSVNNPDMNRYREYRFALEYCATDSNAFGRVGVAHAKGLQESLMTLHDNNQQKANENYLFVYAYDSTSKIQIGDQERAIRDHGQQDLPLNLETFDLSSPEFLQQAVDLICEKIDQKLSQGAKKDAAVSAQANKQLETVKEAEKMVNEERMSNDDLFKATFSGELEKVMSQASEQSNYNQNDHSNYKKGP